jgi:hypothetical protein
MKRKREMFVRIAGDNHRTILYIRAHVIGVFSIRRLEMHINGTVSSLSAAID